MTTTHTPDPDAIAFSSPEAADYSEQVERLAMSVALEPQRELAYGPDRGQRLDVYAPPQSAASTGRFPVVAFFHGGSWIAGHRGWLKFMAPAILALPAVFVAGTYRLAPRCRWPAQFEDVQAALRCVAHNAELIGADARKLVVGGHSAGGHLAALLTLRRGGPPVLACFPVCGPFDLQYGDVPADSQEGRAYKYLFRERRQDFDASPVNFVQGNTTEFHLMWGERDLPHILRTTPLFAAALQRQRGPVTTEVLPGASHFECHLALRDPSHPWYVRLKDVLYRSGDHDNSAR